MYNQIFTTQIAIQGQTSILIANLTNIEHKPVVGDILYGSDAYYAQITRVGESVVEFTVIGQLADLQEVYDFIQDAFDDITANIAFKNQSNVFTQPQQVPNATQPQHAVNKLQVETMFEMFKQQLRGYNLGKPDLTGKTDLGNGEYTFYNADGITVNYNIYNGECVINGASTRDVTLRLSQSVNIEAYIATFYYISGSTTGGTQSLLFANISGTNQALLIANTQNITTQKTSPAVSPLVNNSYVYLYIVKGRTFDNYTFKLQLEKGTVATPYTVPGEIPAYKIVGEE